MKKIIAIILALVLALGCCSALAAETEAISNTLTITVSKYSVTKTDSDDAVASIDDKSEVIFTVTNDQSRDTQWTVKINNIPVTKANGTSMTITAGDILGVVTETDDAEITVTAKTKGGNGTYYDDSNSVSITIPVSYAGEKIEDPTKPDQDATEGEFEVTITEVSTGAYYEGDTIKVSATASVTGTLEKAGYSASDVILTYYVKTPAGTAGVTTAAYNNYIATASGDYKFWAVGKLSTKTAD